MSARQLAPTLAQNATNPRPDLAPSLGGARKPPRLTRASMGIQAEIWRDSCGGVVVYPATERARKLVRERSENAREVLRSGAYLQGDAAEAFLIDDVSTYARRGINAGQTQHASINEELAWALWECPF